MIPMEESPSTEAAPLVNFATDSKSELVYACDASGNQIAVGVFVTDSFHVVDTEDDKIKSSELALDPNANSNWVAAVEECSSDFNGTVPINEDIDSEKQSVIRVYKVNKGPRAKKDVQKERPKFRRTLKNLKKSTAVVTENVVTPRLVKNKQIVSDEQHEKNVKHRRIRRRSTDKCYKGPSKSRVGDLQSRTLFVHPLCYFVIIYVVLCMYSNKFNNILTYYFLQ